VFQKKRLFFVLAAIVLCLLNACGGSAEETTAASTEPIVYYKVDFLVNGIVMGQEWVASGEAPHSPSIEIPGITFAGWLDEAGQPVNIATTKLTADVSYHAKIYPSLSHHLPFLFADDAGFLRPDEDLTADDLTLALNTLASQEAKLYFPTLPEGQTPIDSQQLTAVLSQFFPEDQITTLNLSAGNVTRSQFAVAMCTLLQRGSAETLTLTDDRSVPLDIPVGSPEAIALLEASIVHNVDDAGDTWENTGLSTGLEPGFMNRDGWLYYVQDNGFILRDGNVGVLTFGSDGRYTCGDAELDQIVANVLAQIISENQDASRFDILRKAYEYTRDSFTYLRKDPYLMGDTGWEIGDAKKMFQDTRGNCYYFAGAFWALARGLGYEARAVSGTCTGTNQPHAWVIIAFDGEDYFFDPQWENNYHTREIYDKDMFMLSMDEIWYWTYQWIE